MPSRSRSLTSLLGMMLFPAALVLLLLLSLPGMVLFVLYLLRMEGATNHWLEDHFRLSYHIHIAWWGALTLLVVPFLIVLLYFLKLKRKPLQVPSTFLWRKSIEDVHVNSLFQWLRDNVLLLLQLLTVLFLIFAVMAFQLHGNPSEGRRYIIIIDNSASMSATDVEPNRLEVARKEALQTIDSYGDNDPGMVIVFNSTAKTLQSFTTDRALLRRAVNDIRPSQATTSIKEALDLADSLANPQRSTQEQSVRPAGEEAGKERSYVSPEGVPTEVHLFSDGRFPDLPEFTLGNLNLSYHPIGDMNQDEADNIGLVRLAVSRYDKDPLPQGKEEQPPAARKAKTEDEYAGKLGIYAAVRNYTTTERPVKVEFEVFVNGESQGLYERYVGQGLESKRLAAADPKPPKLAARSGKEPGEGVVHFLIDDPGDTSDFMVHARLVDVQDKFPLDNDAWIVLSVVRKARVLVVTPGNKVLDAFFKQSATARLAKVTFIEPDKLKDDAVYRKPALDGAYDLVIFDRCSPERADAAPQANTFYIYAVPPPWKRADMPMLENPHIRGWDSKHPLLRSLVGLHNIKLSEAFAFELDPKKNPGVPQNVPRLLESDKGAAVLFALSRGSFTDLVMTFPLMNDEGRSGTNWVTDPTIATSFVLFMYRVLYNLGNIIDAVAEEPVQPGQAKQIRPDDPVKEIEVIDPKGNVEKLERGTRPDFAYGLTDQVGVYKVRWDGKVQRSFAVNLLDEKESNIQPKEDVGIGSNRIGKGETRSTPRETWFWFTLAALILLGFEWLLYNWRIFI